MGVVKKGSLVKLSGGWNAESDHQGQNTDQLRVQTYGLRSMRARQAAQEVGEGRGDWFGGRVAGIQVEEHGSKTSLRTRD